MHVIHANQTTTAFRPDDTPVLRVRPGEVVQFETTPAMFAQVERAVAAGERWQEALDFATLNAVTGPVYVEGVAPGDALAVEVLEVRPHDFGFSAAFPGFGMLGDRQSGPTLRRVPIRDGRAILSDRLSCPVRPMIGCLGLAPAAGESSTMRPPYPWGGNYDLPQVAPGNTILLPIQVAGGLFSLGDLHAAMGTGEATAVAIECFGTATVRLGVRKGLALETPRIETPDRLYTVGLHANTDRPSGDYQAARRQAVTLMFAYLTAERGLSPEDAYVVISACVDLEFGGPAAAVVLASVPLAVLG